MFSYLRGPGAVSCLLGKTLSGAACQQRNISTTPGLLGKRNIRKFFLGNKRGSKIFRRQQVQGKYSYAPIYTEVKDTGFKYGDVFHNLPEVIPEIVVPDLKDCELRPYVSYRAADIYQTEFTSQDLFNVVYGDKIRKDFIENKLDDQGNALEPSELEKLTPDEARILARKTGSDIFSEREPKYWECLEKSLIDETPPVIGINSDDLHIRDGRPKFLDNLPSAAPEVAEPRSSSSSTKKYKK